MELQGSGHRQYKVFDYWRSHEDFEGFRGEHQLDIAKFHLLIASEDLIERETLLGSFYLDDSDWDEGTGLVST